MIKDIVKAVVPKSVRWRVKLAAWKMLKNTFETFGYTIARRKDYYSPLSAAADLKATAPRWNHPSLLKGVDYDLGKMESRFSGLISKYFKEFSTLPPYEKLKDHGYGPGFTAVDGMTLYMMMREIKPKRYIEVGSGLSTYYCSLAAKKNASEGHPVQITCVEPYPYAKLQEIPGIEITAKEVQDVDLSLFQQLEENDIFFIDSSHMVKVDGDVPFLLLEVLPSLKSGVMVHVHDVPFPYNIPFPADEWIFKQIWPMLWNEAMMLQAFLCYNNKFKVELSTPLIRYFDESFLKKNVPIYESLEQNPQTFSSMWLQRVAGLLFFVQQAIPYEGDLGWLQMLCLEG